MPEAILFPLPVGIAPAQPSSRAPVLEEVQRSLALRSLPALKRSGFAWIRPCEWPRVLFGACAEHCVVPDGARVARHRMPWSLVLPAPAPLRHREKAPSSQGPRAFAFSAHRQVTPPSRSDPPRPEHPKTGNPVPCLGMGVPLHFEKENVMFTRHATSRMRPIGVLLGGSGRALMPAVHKPMLAALFKPHPIVFARCGAVTERHAA